MHKQAYTYPKQSRQDFAAFVHTYMLYMTKKQTKYSYKIRQKRLSRATYSLFDIVADSGHFFALLGFLILIAFFIKDYPLYARWFGFTITAYGLITNDSIQTLGVFITANAHRTRWRVMWLFVTSIFVITVLLSWFICDQDVSFGRLKVEGLAEDLDQITFLQLIVPIVLLALTRLAIPVSTTFLLLTAFVRKPNVLQQIIEKSIRGYAIAFASALLLWTLILSRPKPKRSNHKPSRIWFALQWISSGLLWMGWLVQDGANMAIFLPRHLGLYHFLAFITCTSLLLGILFYRRGGDMQRIVHDKSGLTDIRAASHVNIFYMVLLFAFAISSHTPMSTTWMFIGLLGGRELATAIWLQSPRKTQRQRIQKSVHLIQRDLAYAATGLIISITLGYMSNPVIREQISTLVG